MTSTTPVRKQQELSIPNVPERYEAFLNFSVFLSVATEESKESDAFGNFLKERKEVVQVRNRKCATPDAP